MRVAFDAVGIRGHGGAAVLAELVHWLPRTRPEWSWDFFMFARGDRLFDDPPVGSGRVVIHRVERASTPIGRLVWSNLRLPGRLRRAEADVLVSFANIGSLRVQTPQVIFVQQPWLVERPEGAAHPLASRVRLTIHRALTNAALTAASTVVVQTESMRAGLARRVPQLADRVAVIPSGYRTPHPDSAVGSRIWKTIGASSRPRLLYVAHPSEHKNHERLVAAFAIVSRAMPAARLLLTIDRQEARDRRYLEFVRRIEGIAAAMGVGDRIVWLGRLTPAEVAFALSGCDLLVYPSLTESFGLPLAEAMHLRCPIAASDRPFAHDVTANAAAYFDPLDPVNMAATIAHVLQNADIRGQLIAAGRARVGRFSYSRIAERLCAILEATAARRSIESFSRAA